MFHANTHVTVETPRGSAAQYAYDGASQAFRLSRILPTGLTFPHDHGFIVADSAQHKLLEVVVLSDVTTFPGTVLECRFVGALVALHTQDGGPIRSQRLLAIPTDSALLRHVAGVADLPDALMTEMEHFYTQLLTLDGHRVDSVRRGTSQDALELMQRVGSPLAA